jgi:glutaredoxin 3
LSRIEIYTTPFCPYCHRAKALLQKKNVDYEEHDVASVPGARREMEERAGGRRTVPQIFVDGRHLGDSDELVGLERAGRLDAALQGQG